MIFLPFPPNIFSKTTSNDLLIDLLWLTLSLEIYYIPYRILIDSFSYNISPFRKNKTPLREMESFTHFRVTSQRAVSMRFLKVQNYVRFSTKTIKHMLCIRQKNLLDETVSFKHKNNVKADGYQNIYREYYIKPFFLTRPRI